MFIIGFLAAWLLFGIFFYIRGDQGSWSIWENRWDTITIMLPAIPIILLIEFIQEKF